MSIRARSPHDDGIRVVRLGSRRRVYLMVATAVALPVLATVVAVAIIRSAPDSDGAAPARPAPAFEVASADRPVAEPRPAASSTAAPSRVVPRRIVTAPVEEPAGLGASPVPQPQKPRREIDAADVIVALREEGVHDGIAAFGIPGTHPPKAGILVPEEFQLPEGYVRHYQSTDDGQQLPAILMFHPDYEFVNEQGEVVKLPDDLVVPPEMAPPGLATDRVLEVPERKAGEPIR
jgi:hypothetical protein